MPSHPTPWRPLAVLTGIASLPPLVVRLLLMIDHRLAPKFGDLAGLTADLSLSLMVASGIGVLVRYSAWGRWVSIGLLGLWSLVNFANYEHIRELGSMVAFAYAGYLADPVFVRGSALAPSRPLMLIVVTLASCLALWGWSRKPRHVHVLWFLVVALTVAALVVAWPADPHTAAWRQSNFVLAQISELSAASTRLGSPPSAIQRAVSMDLDGELFVEALPKDTNVLLVILEGVSGAYLPSLRDRHGAESSIEMRELDRIAAGGLAWSSFVAHQRQTNRGEYAILCGDYPKLITSEPKMTELAGSTDLDCLPAVLTVSGRSATYLQAAPMAFMVKDQFMPQAGFERSLGDTWFDRYYHRNQWGIDDLSFFEQSLGMIAELEDDGRPWFVTLLNVGTHHPFNTPPDFEGSSPHGSPGWAMEYLDRAVGLFISRLEEWGALDNTLVVITSDESREVVPGDSDISNSIRQAWGLLVVLEPRGTSGVVDEPAMQLDLPISVLDVLGLAEGPHGFGGRSVFRRYPEPRELLWGNTHLGLVGGLSAAGQLALCTESFGSCVAKQLEGSLFSPAKDMSPVDPDEVAWLRLGAQASLATQVSSRPARDLPLAAPGSIPLDPNTAEQFIFGGQFLTVPAGSEADIDIEAELSGDRGSVEFHHDFIAGRRQVYLRSGRLGVGDTLRIRYTVSAATLLDQLESRFWVEEIEGHDLEISFRSARVTIRPSAEEVAQSGIVEHLFVIE
jgi:hypothetical protein